VKYKSLRIESVRNGFVVYASTHVDPRGMTGDIFVFALAESMGRWIEKNVEVLT